MTDQHVYDEKEDRRLEAIYTTPSGAERRQLVRDRLGLQSGNEVISIGCGPGFEPAELAEVVGEGRTVYGVDVSEAMLAMADNQCEGLPQVTLEQGDAVDLPVADESFDAAVAVGLLLRPRPRYSAERTITSSPSRGTGGCVLD